MRALPPASPLRPIETATTNPGPPEGDRYEGNNKCAESSDKSSRPAGLADYVFPTIDSRREMNYRESGQFFCPLSRDLTGLPVSTVSRAWEISRRPLNEGWMLFDNIQGSQATVSGAREISR